MLKHVGVTLIMITIYVPKFLKLSIAPNPTYGRQSLEKATRGFRGFVEGVYFIYDKVGWIINNGEKISVWEHNWVPCEEGLRKPSPTLPTRILKLKIYGMRTTYGMKIISEEF